MLFTSLSVRIALLNIVNTIFCVQYVDSIFKKGSWIAFVLFPPCNNALMAVFLLHLFKSDDVQKFAIKLCIERVAVVLEAFFQKMFWTEKLEQFYEALIVACVKRNFVFLDNEPSECQLIQHLGNKISGYLFVEKVSLFRGQFPRTIFFKTFDEFLVGVE